MVCLVLNGRKLKAVDELSASLQEIQGMTSIMVSVNTKNTNVIMGTELIPVWGQGYITDCIRDVRYQISLLSFYQVNPVQTEKFYETALARDLKYLCGEGYEVREVKGGDMFPFTVHSEYVVALSRVTV